MPGFFNQRNRFIRTVQWINAGLFGLEISPFVAAPTNLSLGSYLASAFALSETPTEIESFLFVILNLAGGHVAWTEMQQENANISFLLQSLRMSVFTLNVFASLLNRYEQNAIREQPIQARTP